MSISIPMVFFGTAPLAAVSLEALAAEPSFQILAVVTQPDKPAGRDLKLQPSAVKMAAERLGLPVLQPAKARNPEFIEHLRSLNPQVMVVAAYGQILPQALLDVPPAGCLNIHTSILPKYRGAAPIQWAILNGDATTGVTIMKMDAGLDTGPIISTETTTISPQDNSQTLHDRLAQIGGRLIVATVPDWVRGKLQAQPQPNEEAFYARKISKEDGEINWSEPASTIWNKVRGFTPWPGAFTFYRQGDKERMLKVWGAQVEQGTGEPGVVMEADNKGLLMGTGAENEVLRITEVQKEGSRRMATADFLAGQRFNPGDRLFSRVR